MAIWTVGAWNFEIVELDIIYHGKSVPLTIFVFFEGGKERSLTEVSLAYINDGPKINPKHKTEQDG